MLYFFLENIYETMSRIQSCVFFILHFSIRNSTNQAYITSNSQARAVCTMRTRSGYSTMTFQFIFVKCHVAQEVLLVKDDHPARELNR